MKYPASRRVAVKFCKLLRYSLSKEEMAEVIRRNRTGKYRGACASHDYCDANTVMLLAFRRCGCRLPIKMFLDDDKLIDIWNEAWRLAKASGFSLR